MKISKLLVLGAFALMGTNAVAGVPESTWTMPEPTGLEFTTFTDDGTRYYLYNPGAKMFFASGNSWNTQASVRTFGYPFWLEYSTEEDAPEGSYELWDDFSNADRGDVSGPHNLFTDDGGSTWVDHASQGNYSWSYEIVGDFVRFQNVALIADKPEYEGTYIGWTGDYEGEKNSSVLKMIAPDTEGTCIDWKAVTEDSYLAFVEDEEAYNAYVKGVECFFEASKLHKALVEAEELGANIDAELAIFTNAASTATELKNATTKLNSIIEARKALKKGIEDAKASGFDTTEYEAVYNNGNATAAELTKALEDMNLALVEWGKGHATVENPSDMSAMIKNPNFDNASSTGWSGSSPNMVGSGSHGPANVAETWNNTFDMYQDIEGLPTGLYALGAKTSWRGSWNDMVNGIGPAAMLYAKVGDIESNVPFNYIWACYNTQPLGGSTYFGTSAGENAETHENEDGEEVTYYSPNDPSAFRLYEENGFYDTKVLFAVAAGDTIRIGVKNPAMKGDADNWSCYDTFTLTFYGNGADAAALYLPEALKRYGAYTPEEGTIYTQAYLDAYNALINGEHNAASMEEVTEILKQVDAAYNDLQNNIKMYAKWQATVEKAYSEYMLDDRYAEYCDELSDYYDSDITYDEEGNEIPNSGYESILKNHNLTNEQLEAELARIERILGEIVHNAKHDVAPGDDVTRFMENADFEDVDNIDSGSAKGWTITRIDGGNVTLGPLGQGNYDLMTSALGYMNYCFESWHCHDFDVWQEVTGMPEGVYSIDVQGYVRCENNGYTRGDASTFPTNVPVKLYMNTATSTFPDVYSETRPINPDTGEEYEYTTVESWTTEEINGYLYPNSMGGAAQCFGWGMYKMQAFGLVQEGEPMRIGVKGKMKTDDTENWWCIWDNFKLTYRGYDPQYVQPALEEALTKINTDQHMGKSLFAQANDLKSRAQAAMESADGETMFKMLAEVYSLVEAISNSVTLFEEFWAYAEDFGSVVNESDADATVKTAASDLVTRILDGIESNSFEDEEVEGLKAELDDMYGKLAVPANAVSASDNSPVEFPLAIRNNEYIDNNNNHWLGTTPSFQSYMDAECFQKSFDIYQDLSNLPEGTYMVTLQGMFRAGDAQTDYSAYQQNPDSLNHSFLYATAINGTDSVVSSKALVRMASLAKSEEDGAYASDGYVYAKNPSEEGAGDGWIVPNSMETASYEFADDSYALNNVIVKVGASGKLRVGVKNSFGESNYWTIWNKWTLTYFGANSDKTADSDASGIKSINNGDTFTVEYFTLDGRKANSLQKGIMIQKVTFQNGAVIVKKIRK